MAADTPSTDDTSNTGGEKPTGFEGLASGLAGDKIHPSAKAGLGLQIMQNQLRENALGPLGSMIAH